MLAAIALATAVACETSGPGRPGSGAETASSGDWLVYGDNVEPTTLNCARAAEASALRICRLVADSLIDFDERARFVPRLAESFEVSPDGLTIVFHLRRGVTWHRSEEH